MDAHLFRRFCDAAVPGLQGARLEKIHAPAADVITIVYFNSGVRRQLCLRFGRKDPFAFVLAEPATFGVTPTAQVMRLRKYFSGQRVRACVPQWGERRLWLMAGSGAVAENGEPPALAEAKSAWLCLDLREGPSLHFLAAEDIPEPSSVNWPQPEELQDACEHWRNWPVLSPALRRTLAQLDGLDQQALLADLEMGGGDIFCYRDDTGAVRSVSAWPLPYGHGLEEECGEDALDMLARVGRELVLGTLARGAEREAATRQGRERRKVERLLRTLDEEQARLEAMCARKGDALALQENIWQWPRDMKCASVDVAEGSHGPARTLTLDARFTVRDNMARLFHTADRGARGLAHLEERRAAAQRALKALTPTAGQAKAPGNGAGAATAGTPTDGDSSAEAHSAGANVTLPQLPKRVQGFVSSDGFVLLRGRDSRGNLAARKLAAPHDLWLHAANGPGAHVIIRKTFPGQEVPARTLDEAGCLAALKSWQQNAAKAEITYCEVRHVKPMRNAPAGTVRMDKVWASREVAVDAAVEQRLLAKLGGVE